VNDNSGTAKYRDASESEAEHDGLHVDERHLTCDAEETALLHAVATKCQHQCKRNKMQIETKRNERNQGKGK